MENNRRTRTPFRPDCGRPVPTAGARRDTHPIVTIMSDGWNSGNGLRTCRIDRRGAVAKMVCVLNSSTQSRKRPPAQRIARLRGCDLNRFLSSAAFRNGQSPIRHSGSATLSESFVADGGRASDAPCDQVSCHAAIASTSRQRRPALSTAAGSKPQCVMQSAQRGSAPGP